MRRGLSSIATAILLLAMTSTAAPQEVGRSAASSNGPRGEAGAVLQFASTYESLTHDFDPWRSAVLSLDVSPGHGTRYRGEVREQVRFGQLDHALLAGVHRRLSRGVTADAELDISPSHHVSPTWGVRGALEWAAGRGWVARGSLDHRRYTSTPVDLGSLAVDKYLGAYRVAYTAYLARLAGAQTAISQRVEGHLYYGPSASRVGVSAAAGEEVESLPALGVLRTPVRSFAITGRHWLGSRWFVTYDALLHEQGTLYVRHGLGVGVGRRF